MNRYLQQYTKLLNFILLCVTVYICYKFYYDVVYKLQFQIPLITKTYYIITSREFCMVLIIIFLVCILIMRWWFTLIWLLPLLPFSYYVLYWLKIRYNYTQGFINGMIWSKEYFNYNLNLYVFKGLEEWQKAWVIKKEIGLRQNLVSFIVYGECRDFENDPEIMHFFDDFHLDYDDSESFARIRNQIDIYQRARIILLWTQNNYYRLKYQADHPFLYRLKYYSQAVFDYVTEYPERIFAYTFLAIIGGALGYYHL